MIQRIVNAVTFVVALGICWVLLQIFGPQIERQFIRPINSLTFSVFQCAGDDVFASGILDKAFWPGDRPADYLGMTLYATDVSPRERLVWRGAGENNASPASRPGGRQGVDIIIENACGRPFTAHTKHRSPVTGWVQHMAFGPFQEQGE